MPKKFYFRWFFNDCGSGTKGALLLMSHTNIPCSFFSLFEYYVGFDTSWALTMFVVLLIQIHKMPQKLLTKIDNVLNFATDDSFFEERINGCQIDPSSG